MKTILVTGSAGFIGSNLVLRLFKELSEGTIVGYVRGQVPDTGGRYMPPEADYLLCSLDDSSVYAC